MSHELDRIEGNMQVATQIAIDAGAISECENHPGTYLDNLDSEAQQGAYKLANHLYSNGDERLSDFRNREELRDTVRQAICEAGEECYSCAKWREE